jgi:hypothetical protein
VENFAVEAIVTVDKGVMCPESQNDLERLQRQVEKAKTLIHQSGIKVEELETSVRNIGDFKDRFVLFTRNIKRNSADRPTVSPNGKPDPFKVA